MSALKVGSYTPPDENGEGEKTSVSSTDRDISSKTKMRFTTDRMTVLHPGIIRYGVHEKQHPAGVQSAGRFGRGSFRGTGLAARK